MVRHLPAQSPDVVPRPFGLAVHSANNRFSTLLFSASSELLFPQLLSFHNLLRCPLVFSSVRSLPAAAVRSVLDPCFNSFAMRRLRPLACPEPRRELSCLSFLYSFPLFSKACGLFCQNAGDGVSRPKLCALRGSALSSSIVRAALSSVSQSAQRGRLPHIQVSSLHAQGSQVNG
jgi:hypothetical protein